MQRQIEMVREFHNHIHALMREQPQPLDCEKSEEKRVATELRQVLGTCQQLTRDPDDLMARLALSIEELAEWVESHVHAQGEDRPEICELLDSWADRAYTLYGDAVATEIAHVATEIFAEVHRSNMSKTKASKNELGKGKKGDEFQSPRLSQFFDAPTDG
jgi:predicted HAD superfamily Cof-like phosphohydrolase